MSWPSHLRAFSIGALLSSLAHLFLLFALPVTPGRASASERSYLVHVDPVRDPDGADGADSAGQTATSAERAEAGGQRSAQNIDAADRGAGGDRTGATRVVRMLDRAQGILLLDSPLNNLATSQTQRIRTSRSRASQERRRATPNPHDQPFLASGRGEHAERRPVSALDPTTGASAAPEASVVGGTPSVRRVGAVGLTAAGDGEGPPQPSAGGASASGAASGAPEPSPGVGLLDARGASHRRAARVAHGRPSVDEGPAATPGETRDPRVRDDSDAELLADRLVQGWVESTRRSGREAGDGRGGVAGPGAPGSGGGRREGGRATAHGTGDGDFAALDTRDARYRRWFLRLRRRIHDALEWPRARALAMDQGTAVYAVRVRRDGTLVGAPRLVRSSGFSDLDRAALDAIRAATPFGALPADLAPGRERLAIQLPIEFSNPMVR